MMTGRPTTPTPAERALLRHYLAATAYRTQKALRGAPVGYADFRAAPGVRTPHQLLRHMSDVLGYARTLFTGGRWRAETLPTFADEIARFHEILEDLGRLIDESDFENVSLASAPPGAAGRRHDARRTARDAAKAGGLSGFARELRRRGRGPGEPGARPGQRGGPRRTVVRCGGGALVSPGLAGVGG